MSKFIILIEGYAQKIKNGWVASSSVTLIEDCGKKIIVDPGTNKKLLLGKLKKEKLSPKDINIVFLSHYHPDHIVLTALFDQAIIVDGEMIYNDDQEMEHAGNLPWTNIEIIPTPGHTDDHSSLLMHTEMGKIAIVADLFWWTNEESQETNSLKKLINKEDPFAENEQILKESRKKILDMADWIIPGHGKIFKTPAH